jgi:hypothetical protein
MDIPGTYFANTSVTSPSEILTALYAHTFPPNNDFTVPPSPQVNRTITDILNLYPDDPSQGAPFGTGNQTFGLSPEFKHMAAIFGDLRIHATRRAWIQAASRRGVKSWGYLFSDVPPPGPLGYPAPYMGGKSCISQQSIRKV